MKKLPAKHAKNAKRRVLGDFLIQQEFNFNHSARGAGPGRNLTVSCDSDQDRRALSPTA